MAAANNTQTTPTSAAAAWPSFRQHARTGNLAFS